ncbi:hypothetical protein P7K49_028855 [Saguinus oedipus]|uniref:Uncharacterized protein n=1 Tax=Saguinus oedipus TaxID=9490 RepID=A0ABQ9U5J8_SAGOE|nr:hypothetical protein P7K49_028855 [Saguinus oedipus]
MAKLGGSVNELKVNLQSPLLSLHQQELVKGQHSILGSHDTAFQRNKVIGHFIIIDKATQRVDALVKQVIVSGGIVLDELAILDNVALANLKDLLVDFSAVMVAFLPSMCHTEGHMGGMPCPNTGHLAQVLVGPAVLLLSVSMTGIPFVAFALGHPDDVDHLVLPKLLVHRYLLLQPLVDPVHLLSHVASVHLDLQQMGRLLVQRKQEHLGTGNDVDDLAGLLQLLLAILILPFLTVLGEGLPFRFMPVLIEMPLALITDVLSKDGLEGPEASRGFHVAHNDHNYHGWRLHSGHSLHLLLVHLGSWPFDFLHDVGHARKAVRWTGLEGSSLEKLFTFLQCLLLCF